MGGIMTLFFLCLKIFLARIVDVSLGTIRTILTVKERSFLASLIGFVEVLVWFIIVQETLNTTETSIVIAISYALGFATGTYIGSILSRIFITGNLSVQVITTKEELVTLLREKGYGVSIMDITGREKKNQMMLFIEIIDKNMNHLESLIHKVDPKAFIVVNETKYVQNGYLLK